MKYEEETTSSLSEKNAVGILKLRSILTSSESPTIRPTVWFDLDGSIKEYASVSWPDGERKVFPETIAALRVLAKRQINLAISTDQSLSEMEPWLNEVSQLLRNSQSATLYDTFQGPLVLERGNVIVNTELRAHERKITVYASEQAQKDSKSISTFLQESMQQSDEEIWSYFRPTTTIDSNEHINALVRLAKEDRITTVVFVTKGGLRISEDPKIRQICESLCLHINDEITRRGIQTLEVFLGNNGIMIIMPIGSNKVNPVDYLIEQQFFDSEHSVFVCDGTQDLQFADKFSGIITPSNADTELKRKATFCASQPAGKGFAEAIAAIFPQEYAEAYQDVINEANSRKLRSI